MAEQIIEERQNKSANGPSGEYLSLKPFAPVSAYTPERFISNQRHEFGSVIRFLEGNFGIPQGSLNFADARASTDLSEFFEIHNAPRAFKTIPAGKKAKYFIDDKTPATDPDDD